MVFIVLSWIFMVPCEFSWFSCLQLGFYDFSRFHWFFMVSLVFHGFSWFQVGFPCLQVEFLMFFMVLSCFFVVYHGFRSVFMVFVVPAWFFIFTLRTS